MTVMIAKNAILYQVWKIHTFPKNSYFSFVYCKHVISCTFCSIEIYQYFIHSKYP